MLKKLLPIVLFTLLLSSTLGVSYAEISVDDASIDFKALPTKEGSSKLNLINNLPGHDKSWNQLIASAIKLVLNISGTLAFISFTVGGIMLVTAQGKEEQLSKGKLVLFWSIGALAIIAVSYAIVLGISNLSFFGTQVK